MDRIDSGFAELLGTGSKGDERPADEGEDTEGDKEDEGGFVSKWGWIANVDEVSETCRCSWDDVLRKPAIEFLNVLSYRRDKAAWEESQRKKYIRNN